MNENQLKNELQTILSGKSSISYDATIQTITSYLRGSKSTSTLVEKKFKNQHKETENLLNFAKTNNLLLEKLDTKKYISQGAEQRVYIKNSEYVFKLNDAIYYTSWLDYFYNILLHNFFFADTAYQFLGFYVEEETLLSVVKQPFIKATTFTNLNNVKVFMQENGFVNHRNHDYYHPKLGIILEDLHDENVLTQNNILYFIDTVFYIKPEIFWEKK